ncbi:type II toxin-antitoxin system PemK/MazF family toxin [Aquipuribacter nitratireducens]|uniref:Type II toxin-antitoxin system PemK/MazF family toxin n=1 Tax=Aquipuribacter nitratireducens TaxID=650104 RepID=A0ABW0GHC4_9MICO
MTASAAASPAFLDEVDPTVLAVAAGLVVVLLWAVTRRQSRRPTRRPTRRRGRRTRQPAVGDIWWADVPFEDGTGSKDRPCLVVETHGLRTVVLSITSTDKSGRRGWVEVPRHGWAGTGGISWLRTDRRIVLDPHRLRRYAGPCPTSVRKTIGL